MYPMHASMRVAGDTIFKDKGSVHLLAKMCGQKIMVVFEVAPKLAIEMILSTVFIDK